MYTKWEAWILCPPLSLLLQQKNPSIETLNLLLEKKALVSVPDCSEQTPLDYARKLDCPERDAIISKLENQKNYEKENIIELCIVDEENLKMILYGKIATNNSDPSMLIYKIEEDTKNYKITWPFYFNLLPTGIGIFTDKNSNKIYHFQIHNGNISYVRDEKRLLTEDPINQVIQSMATNLNEKIITMYSKFSDNK